MQVNTDKFIASTSRAAAGPSSASVPVRKRCPSAHTGLREQGKGWISHILSVGPPIQRTSV